MQSQFQVITTRVWMGPFKPKYAHGTEVGQMELPTRDVSQECEVSMFLLSLVWVGQTCKTSVLKCISQFLYTIRNPDVMSYSNTHKITPRTQQWYKHSSLVLLFYSVANFLSSYLVKRSRLMYTMTPFCVRHRTNYSPNRNTLWMLFIKQWDRNCMLHTFFYWSSILRIPIGCVN
jgi:hypothetical protein